MWIVKIIYVAIAICLFVALILTINIIGHTRSINKLRKWDRFSKRSV